MNNSVGKIIRIIGIINIILGALAGIITWIAVDINVNGAIGFASAVGQLSVLLFWECSLLVLVKLYFCCRQISI